MASQAVTITGMELTLTEFLDGLTTIEFFDGTTPLGSESLSSTNLEVTTSGSVVTLGLKSGSEIEFTVSGTNVTITKFNINHTTGGIVATKTDIPLADGDFPYGGIFFITQLDINLSDNSGAIS